MIHLKLSVRMPIGNTNINFVYLFMYNNIIVFYNCVIFSF